MMLTKRSPRVLAALALVLASGVAAPSFASTSGAPGMTVQTLTGGMVLARRGADDGANHDAGDDRGRRGRGTDDGAGHTAVTVTPPFQMARHGADDGASHDAGDDRGGRRG